MLESAVVSAGLKLDELAEFDVGAGVILLTLQDAGKPTRGVTYPDMYEAVRLHLPRRLERFRISNAQVIVDALLSHLRARQSVFTMAAQ
jgi:hypothetical protein